MSAPAAPEQTGFTTLRVSAKDGLRIAVRDYRPAEPRADRTPLLCLTGLTRNARDFHDIALHESRERRVVCLDYIGRGRSDYAEDWRRYEPMKLLDDVAQVVGALGLHRFVVIGTSLGGLVAMGLALTQPTRLAGVVLNDIGPDLPQSGQSRILELVGRDYPQRDWAGATDCVKTIFAGLGLSDEADWRRVAEATFVPGDDGLLHVDWDINLVQPLLKPRGERPDIWAMFHALRPFPALALRGATSDILSAETHRRMEKEHKGLMAVEVPGRGHAPLLNEPESRDALDALFRQIDGTPQP